MTNGPDVQTNPETVRELPTLALRELLRRSIDETKESNRAQADFVARMRQDAAEFATTMRAAGARTDTAYNDDGHYPLWIIRSTTKYGGGSLVEDERRHLADDTFRFISIFQNGYLGIALKFGRGEWHDLHYIPGRRDTDHEFTSRSAFDDPSRVPSLHAEWVADLEQAAATYTRAR